MLQLKKINNLNEFIFFFLLVWCLYRASSTEIRVNTWLSYNIIDLDIAIPVALECHSIPQGYQEVLWYKDGGLVVKKSHTDRDASELKLVHIMWNASYSVDFGNALKLQGLYWCETDNMGSSKATKYLFKIQGIHTFAGKFLAMRDTLDDNKQLSFDAKLSIKRASYENDIQEVLFSSLPKPNAYVTNITIMETGMEVRFYLYVGQRNNWRPILSDQLALEQVLDTLHCKDGLLKNNERMTDWKKQRGIEQIIIRSTLGCYRYTYMVPAHTHHDISSENDVISRNACSAKNASVNPVCTGDIYTGFHWIDPSGKCNIIPSKFNFSGIPRPFYRRKLQEKTSEMPTVTDFNIMTELTETYDLNLKEMQAVFSVINNLFTIDRSKLEEAKSTIKLTSRLLRMIDNIMTKASQWEEKVTITKDNLLLNIERFKNVKGEDFVVTASTMMHALLPSDVQIGSQDEYLSQVVFFADWILFPDPKDVLIGKKNDVLPSPVMYMTINGGTPWNSTHPLSIYFKNEYEYGIENPVCVHFDPLLKDGEGGWSAEGCEYVGINNGFFSCICHNHSIFSIVIHGRRGYKTPDYKIPDIKIPDFKFKDTEKVERSNFKAINLFWIVPLAILMYAARIIMKRTCRSWCNSMCFGERRARTHDEALVT